MIYPMRSKRRKALILVSALVSTILIVAACSSDDITGTEVEPEGGPPWADTDSAWKVIENLRYAYITMDLDLYMSCFRDDFEFWPLPILQDSCWGYEFEEQCHQNMFDYVEYIDLLLQGDTEYLWSGDSTGQSLALLRSFDLKVFLSLYEGYRGSGNALFICRQDSTSMWYLWKWYDQSDTKEDTPWGGIKETFSSSGSE